MKSLQQLNTYILRPRQGNNHTNGLLNTKHFKYTIQIYFSRILKMTTKYSTQQI